MIQPKRYRMALPSREIEFGDRTLIMGIVNVTPDSFSDGGKYMEPGAAADRALELEAQGADIIDIGAESTRPGSERISEAEELRRLVPVLKRLKGKLDVPISVDTTRAAVAEKALEHGAEFINDISALTFDADLAKVVGNAGAGLILNHMRGTPESWAKLGTLPHPMKTVVEELEAAISRARRGGIERGRILCDPGLGFGKRGEQNYELLARLGEMAALDVPILVGPSRKSFLSQSETVDADRATAAAVTVAVLHGAHIVRVHDVAAIRPVLQTADGVLRSLTAAPPRAAAPRTKRTDMVSEPIRKPVRPPVPTPEVIPEERPRFAARTRSDEGDERPRRTFSSDGPPKRPYRRPEGGDDRPPRRQFDGADRPPRRTFSNDGPPKRPYRRPEGSDDRPPRRNYGDNDRPPRRTFSSDGPPKRPYRRPEGGDDRPPRRQFEGGDRPPRRTFSNDGPPKRPYRRPEGGDDRPPRRTFSNDGPPKRPYRRPEGGDDRPPRREFGGGDGPPKRAPYRGPGGDDSRPPRKFGASGRPAGGKRPGGAPPRRSPVRGPRPPRRED